MDTSSNEQKMTPPPPQPTEDLQLQVKLFNDLLYQFFLTEGYFEVVVVDKKEQFKRIGESIISMINCFPESHSYAKLFWEEHCGYIANIVNVSENTLNFHFYGCKINPEILNTEGFQQIRNIILALLQQSGKVVKLSAVNTLKNEKQYKQEQQNDGNIEHHFKYSLKYVIDYVIQKIQKCDIPSDLYLKIMGMMDGCLSLLNNITIETFDQTCNDIIGVLEQLTPFIIATHEQMTENPQNAQEILQQSTSHILQVVSCAMPNQQGRRGEQSQDENNMVDNVGYSNNDNPV